MFRNWFPRPRFEFRNFVKKTRCRNSIDRETFQTPTWRLRLLNYFNARLPCPFSTAFGKRKPCFFEIMKNKPPSFDVSRLVSFECPKWFSQLENLREQWMPFQRYYMGVDEIDYCGRIAWKHTYIKAFLSILWLIILPNYIKEKRDLGHCK